MPHAQRLLLMLCLTIAGVATAGEARAQGDDARYALAGGCYALKPVAAGRVVSKTGDGSYTAAGGGEPFRMQATALGRYLFYGAKGDFMAAGKSGPLPGAPDLPVPTVPVATGAADDPVKSVAAPSPAADWRVDAADGAFAISLPDTGRVLAVDSSGRLIAAPRGAGRSRFTFERRTGCARYPRSRSTRRARRRAARAPGARSQA